MQNNKKAHLLLNLDKKKIIDPKDLLYSGVSSIFEISHVRDEIGNPFQYELFHLLMDRWKSDRITLVQDTLEARNYLIQVEKYSYHTNYKFKLNRELVKEDGLTKVIIDDSELNLWKSRWKEFINNYVLINYDYNLFMTIDNRLYRQAYSIMPYFALAQGENKEKSQGSWSTHRIGVEPNGTSTFDHVEYFEMFRLIGRHDALTLSKEQTERDLGLRI